MKKLLSVVLSITMLCCISTVAAQKINGIRVECSYPIEVFLDGQQMSFPVQSAMICNIGAGNYLVEAFAILHDGFGEYRECVYKERIYYPGNRVIDILIENNSISSGLSYTKRPLDDIEFKKFMETFKAATFESEKNNLIDVAVANMSFFTYQVEAISREFMFDSKRLELLKKLYPSIVDKENIFQLFDVLTFSSTKKEFADFVK